MSSWIHVCGIIRMNDLRASEDDIPDFDDLIGKECSYDDLMYDDEIIDDIKTNPNKYLPLGSEGSLSKSIWINDNIHHTDAYTISIFGDLRDCYEEDAEKIIEWFKIKCAECNTRDAMISIRVNTNEPIIWHL